MSGWRLTLKQAPALRLDLRSLSPNRLAALSADQIERLPLAYGNALSPLAEFFSVAAAGDGALRLEGEGLARCDRIGWRMDGGRLIVEGAAGHHAGGLMSAGEMSVKGSAGLLAACEMSGGSLTVDGDVGDFAAGTLPGSMDGMRGGTLLVKGNAGERFGDRMRRGTALVFGSAGDFLASRMVAGTIAVAGGVGAHPGYGMRRGSVILRQPPPRISPSFVPAIAEAPVFWQLLARDLSRQGGPFADLASRPIERHLGDLASDGRGELILVR